MDTITLQTLLEAGCHFGHKAERWNPKAGQFIYTKKDGIHIIDLAKTKAGLEAAAAFIKETVSSGREVIFVGTKRQAAGVVKEEATGVGAPYFVERWIGGFLTNWDQIKKNIQKIISMDADRASGAWKKFPKHEQVKMGRYLDRIKIYYAGVLSIKDIPGALVVVDIKKEEPAVREGKRRGVPVVGIVDTNADPTMVDWVIPANDDAVGSIQCIIHYLAASYKEGKAVWEKANKEVAPATPKVEEKKEEVDNKPKIRK
ncbi:MAG: 30S ribosomal protein S2 [Candidatus Gottesmanbacteria bacterium GW2011_GWB1_49_7]|uniref:Small ribosomal subunit protein uS2 n=1 Tax=Candidatus Gottesmanbacteria bacterium GW2011_GWB1_49_7 TaxID=1618448 RepID=A0A0G1VYL4_9BACT|nr:MAG: 30S ribosomal protein S2 [Candidatus Gottesmanbacteria bacterium GW2011_GWB1_49_7]